MWRGVCVVTSSIDSGAGGQHAGVRGLAGGLETWINMLKVLVKSCKYSHASSFLHTVCDTDTHTKSPSLTRGASVLDGCKLVLLA